MQARGQSREGATGRDQVSVGKERQVLERAGFQKSVAGLEQQSRSEGQGALLRVRGISLRGQSPYARGVR
jgi:hypothetical protein